MERAMPTSAPPGSDRTEASQRLETVISLCTAWLATSGISPTSIRRFSRGFLRSARWELTSPPSGDSASSTVLQATLVPCSTTEPYHDGFRPCYRVLVYSFLTERQTTDLRLALRSITLHGGLDLSLFWSSRLCCKRLL